MAWLNEENMKGIEQGLGKIEDQQLDDILYWIEDLFDDNFICSKWFN